MSFGILSTQRNMPAVTFFPHLGKYPFAVFFLRQICNSPKYNDRVTSEAGPRPAKSTYVLLPQIGWEYKNTLALLFGRLVLGVPRLPLIPLRVHIAHKIFLLLSAA